MEQSSAALRVAAQLAMLVQAGERRRIRHALIEIANLRLALLRLNSAAVHHRDRKNANIRAPM
jgi:hypothetical protein